MEEREETRDQSECDADDPTQSVEEKKATNSLSAVGCGAAFIGLSLLIAIAAFSLEFLYDLAGNRLSPIVYLFILLPAAVLGMFITDKVMSRVLGVMEKQHKRKKDKYKVKTVSETWVKCELCSGSGSPTDFSWDVCPACGGKGRYLVGKDDSEPTHNDDDE